MQFVGFLLLKFFDLIFKISIIVEYLVTRLLCCTVVVLYIEREKAEIRNSTHDKNRVPGTVKKRKKQIKKFILLDTE